RRHGRHYGAARSADATAWSLVARLARDVGVGQQALVATVHQLVERQLAQLGQRLRQAVAHPQCRLVMVAMGATERRLDDLVDDAQRVEAQPAGGTTDQVLHRGICKWAHPPSPRAPPEPPSPPTVAMIGTLSFDITIRLRAMASLWPRSSASIPGKAPGVSMKVRIGRRKRSAISIRRSALR